MDDTAPAARSPRVLTNRWGHLDVEGLGELKDAKLWPGGGREWDWTDTGTQHHPGIQPGDVRELLDHDPEGDAIDAYNDLADGGARVAALLHSTC